MSFGIKVSQPGIDVDGAPDFRLAFTSEWPVLKIHKQGAFTMTNDLNATTITDHNLGYPPAFMIFKTTGSRSQLAGPGNDEFGDSFYVDKNNLGYTVSGAAGGNPYTGYYIIFRQNLTTNYTAPTIALGNQPIAGGGKFGIKTSKPSHEASDNDERNLSLDSNTRSPMIHQIVAGTQAANGTNFDLVATHNLIYAPFFLSYISATGANQYYAFFGGNANNVIIVTDRTITQRSGSVQDGSIIVFKDPFFIL